MSYLPASQTDPIIAYLELAGVTAATASQIIGRGKSYGEGYRQILGPSRLRRDKVQKLADALDSEFLRMILAEELYYDEIRDILPNEDRRTFDIEVDELHNFVADDVVVHNCAPPFRQAEFDLMYGTGISKEGSLLDVAVEQGLIRKSGAWFTYKEEQIGQGRENAKAFLSEHPEMIKEIEQLIMANLAPQPDENGEIPPPVEEPLDDENGLSKIKVDDVMAGLTAKAGGNKGNGKK